jgi:hypothetical protein
MAAAMRTAIERPNSRHRRGIWAYMDIKDNRTIKDTYRTITDTIDPQPPPMWWSELIFFTFIDA